MLCQREGTGRTLSPQRGLVSKIYKSLRNEIKVKVNTDHGRKGALESCDYALIFRGILKIESSKCTGICICTKGKTLRDI